MNRIFLLLLIPFFCLSQTGIYSTDGVLTVKIPTSVDILLGYPLADDLDSKAISQYNKGTEIMYNLNNLKKDERKKRLFQAIDHFIAAVNYDKKFIQAYDNLGKAYRMIGNYKLAIESYKISIKIFPNGVSAHQNLAIAYNKLKEWDNSIMEFKTVIKLSPNSPEGYYGIASVYQKKLKLNLALSNALTALKLYKKNPPNFIGDSYGQVGLIYYYKGNKDEARKYILISKKKNEENNFDERFYSTYPKKILNELNIK